MNVQEEDVDDADDDEEEDKDEERDKIYICRISLNNS